MNPINRKYEDVYFVDAPRKCKLNPVAIRPEINLTDGYIRWEDTSRGGFASIEDIATEPGDSKDQSAPKKITIRTEDGDKIIFVLLNLEIYNEKVREWVYNQPKFKTDSELKTYYLTTKFGQ